MLLNSIVLQVTSLCPYKCPQCYMQKGDSHLPLDTAKRYIDYANQHGAKIVQLTGGEPVAYPYLLELLRYISQYRMPVFMATSGYAHSYGGYDLLKRNGLSAICISINDVDENRNAKARDAFAQSISAINDAKDVQLACFGNVVVSDDNIDRLALLGEYLEKKGVLGMNILRPIKSFDGKYVPNISNNTIELLYKIVDCKRYFYRVENCFREYWEFSNKKPFKCFDIGNKTLFINVDGTVSPCSKMTKYKYHSLSEMFTQYRDWGRGCYDTK